MSGDSRSITLYDAPGSCSIVGCDQFEVQQLLDWANTGAKGKPPVDVKVVDRRA